MKDYRLRIGMRFVQQGREFVIEGPLPDDQLKIKDTFTDVCSARTTADMLEDLFAGRLELIGAGNEGKVLRAPWPKGGSPIDACLELVHLWIVDVYHQTVHRGIRDIPHRGTPYGIFEVIAAL